MPRIKKVRESDIDRVARQIELPTPHNGNFKLTDKVAYSSKDASAALRSGEKQTLKRMTRIERLQSAGVLTAEQARACEWYADAYELGFATTGGVANYGGAGGGTPGSRDHSAKSMEVGMARDNYLWAREAIPDWLIPTFEGVVLTPMHEQQLRRVINNNDSLGTKIKLAADLLYDRVNYVMGAG